MRVHAKRRLRPNEIRVLFQQKMDSNAPAVNTVGIMTMAGKGYVIDFYLCHGYWSNFFMNTVQRVLVTHTKDLGQIIDGLHIAAGKIGGYIDVQTAIAVSQLSFNHRVTKNLLQHIVEFSVSLLDGWDGVDGKVTTRRWDRRSRHGW